MEHRTTRPHTPVAACRIGRYVVPVATLAWLAGGPVFAQIGTAQVDRVIDGDTIRDQAVGWSGWARSGVRCREEG